MQHNQLPDFWSSDNLKRIQMEQSANQQVIIIDWNTFFWVLGVIVMAFGGMVTAISILFKGSISDIREEQKEMRVYMINLQEQVRDNSEETKLALQAIKSSQDHETKRLDSMQDTFAEKLSAGMIETLKFLQGYEPVKAEAHSKSGRNKR